MRNAMLGIVIRVRSAKSAFHVFAIILLAFFALLLFGSMIPASAGRQTGASANCSVAGQGPCLHLPGGKVYRFRRP